MESVFRKRHTSVGISTKKQFTSNIFLCCNIPFDCYADHSNKLGIMSLEYHKLEFDIILMFIYYNLSDLPFI